MIELTENQRQELEQTGIASALDSKTNVEYVLVRADIYAKMRAIIDGMTKRAGWDDPKLDEYERYRKTS